MDLYKIAVLISPFVATGISVLVTYKFTIKQKKFELLNQFKVPAFRELVEKLTDYQNFCVGKVSYYTGNEYSPYFETGPGTLHHRTLIDKVFSINRVYFSVKSNEIVNNMLNDMGLLCNIEAMETSGNDIKDFNMTQAYIDMSDKVQDCIDALYKEFKF